jgi:hypothetical protein
MISLFYQDRKTCHGASSCAPIGTRENLRTRRRRDNSVGKFVLVARRNSIGFAQTTVKMGFPFDSIFSQWIHSIGVAAQAFGTIRY